MADIRDDLLRLAAGWETQSVLSMAEHDALVRCARNLRALLATHPAPSSSADAAPRTDPLSRRRGINEARAAFERVAAGQPVRCIPATAYDDDMVLIDVLAEWEQMRWAALPKRTAAPSLRSEAGGVCDRCRGSGLGKYGIDEGAGDDTCPDCKGTGRVPVPAARTNSGSAVARRLTGWTRRDLIGASDCAPTVPLLPDRPGRSYAEATMEPVAINPASEDVGPVLVPHDGEDSR